MPPLHAYQPSFSELGALLHDVTFVTVDLETTGGAHDADRITEIGAVKTRGGEVLGQFASLVNPGIPIPPGISALTGITEALTRAHPPVEAVLPAFLEFARGAVLVAHNARFDIGFLNANLARLDYPRLEHPVVCTAALARRLVRDEVHDVKLVTLAAHFATRTQPLHRALADAQATVEVFHALLERAGSFGVLTLEDLVTFAQVRNTPLFKARKRLVEGLPEAPGVYVFRSAAGEVLYVGKATNLRTRVRSYFGNDDRRRVVDLLKESARVEHEVCATPIEAGVRELRLIAAAHPRFNRRSKHAHRGVYVTLTRERFPRLSVVRIPREDAVALGPLATRRSAQELLDAIHDVFPIRRCTARLGGRDTVTPCALAALGRCLAPCDAMADAEAYALLVRSVDAALRVDPSPLLAGLHTRMTALAEQGRYEEAAGARDRLGALVHALDRVRRVRRLRAPGELVAAAPRAGGFDLVRIRDGLLVASGHARSADPRAIPSVGLPAEALGPLVLSEEALLLDRWLEQPDVRLLSVDGVLASDVAGARLLHSVRAELGRARRSTGQPAAELVAKRLRRVASSATARP